METNFDSPAPPMGGENLALKELKSEEEIAKAKKKALEKKKKINLVLLLSLIVVFLIGIVIGFFLKNKQSPSISPSPRPVKKTPLPSASFLPKPLTLEGKIKNFEANLKNLDFQESALNLPTLDFNIRFQPKEK